MDVFIELTNLIHGGDGWEFGKVLWSPVASSWNNIMQMPKEGDIILHSIKTKSINHRLWGISTVDNSYNVLSSPPPIPEKWDKYTSYYQIPLKNYKEFKEKIFLQDIIDENQDLLKKMIPQKSFYTESGKRMQPAQKYLAHVSDELYEIIKPYLEIVYYGQMSIDNISENSIREEEINLSQHGSPERVKTVLNRIIRDTRLIKKMKSKYNNQCQICGKIIKLYNEKAYSEGHHLQKLGGIHQGPDIEENIIILCPNHHVEFDYGMIAIDTHSGKIIHHNHKDVFHNKELAYKRRNLSKTFLEYHYTTIFNNRNEV